MRAIWLSCCALLACDAGSSTVPVLESGSVIAINEGESRTIRLPAPATLGSDIARIEGQTNLVIEPPCSAVTGTDGPPVAFPLEVAGTRIVVEVQPSALGICRPKLVVCKPMGVSTCMGYAKKATECTDEELVTGQRIDVDYSRPGGRFSDPEKPDQVVLFELSNPDEPDDLHARITSDGPLRFPARVTNEEKTEDTSFCQVIPNSNVTGAFTLSYTIARGRTATSPVVAAGQYELAWNKDQLYGIEPLWCAAQPPLGCKLDKTATGYCIDGWNGRSVSIGMRVWASGEAARRFNDPFLLNMVANAASAPLVELTSETQKTQRAMTLSITRGITTHPLEIVADLGATEREIDLSLLADSSPEPFLDKFELTLTPCP